MGEDDKEKFAKALCDSLFEVMERGQLSPQVEDLLLTPNLDFTDPIHAVMFSGGVSRNLFTVTKNAISATSAFNSARKCARAPTSSAAAIFRCVRPTSGYARR